MGEDRLGEKELDTIYQAQLDQGIKNTPLLSSLLVRESRRALDRNDLKNAEILCDYAKKFAPDFPSPYFAMGRVYWSQSKTLVTLALREYWRGVYTMVRNFRVLFFESLNILYLISGALLLTFVAFTLVILLKYFIPYFYDLRKEFDLTPVKVLFSLSKIFVLLVPLFLNFDLLWTFLFWTILIWGYLVRRERQMLVVFLFVLVYVPWVLAEATDFLEKPELSLLMTLHQANETNWDKEAEKRIKQWSRERTEDAEIPFTLGLLNKREGRYKEAESYYEKALQYDPNWPECISNLGNIYLSTGHPKEDAVAQYELAISLSPKKYSFYFNLHRALSRDSILPSDRVGQALQMADKLDPGRVAFHTQILSDNMNRSVIDDTVSAGRLWKRVLRFFQNRIGLPDAVLDAWRRGVPGQYEQINPVFFSVFLVLFAFYCSRKDFSKRCPMCGTPSVKFFTRKIEGDKVCIGCNRLFVKRDSIDPKMKDKKMEQVKRFEKRSVLFQKVMSFIIPGGGHLWNGQSIKGSLFVFIFSLFGLRLLYWNGMVHDPIFLGESSGFWNRFVFVLFILAYYIGVLWSSLRIESGRSLKYGPTGIPKRF